MVNFGLLSKGKKLDRDIQYCVIPDEKGGFALLSGIDIVGSQPVD